MPCKIIFVLQVSLECRAGSGVTGTGWMGMASLSWLSPRLSGQQLSPFPHALVGLFFLVVYNHKMWQLMIQSL